MCRISRTETPPSGTPAASGIVYKDCTALCLLHKAEYSALLFAVADHAQEPSVMYIYPTLDALALAHRVLQVPWEQVLL